MNNGYKVKTEIKAKDVLIPGVNIFYKNAFCVCLELPKIDKCDFDFHVSSIGCAGQFLFNKNNEKGARTLANYTYNNHNIGRSKPRLSIGVDHLMIPVDNDLYRDCVINELRERGKEDDRATYVGETAIMYPLNGAYLGYHSMDFHEGTHDLSDDLIIPHADGIGTKPLIYPDGNYDYMIDGIAMNYNDILAGLLQKPGLIITSILYVIGNGFEYALDGMKKRFEQEIQKRQIHIGASDHIYAPNFNSVEADMVMYGFLPKDKLIKYDVKTGDIIIGIQSSGVHSNGLSDLARMGQTLSEEEREKLNEKLAVPTIIYDKVFKAIKGIPLTGAVNVTGGALTKNEKLLEGGLRAVINNNHNLEPYDFMHQYLKYKEEQFKKEGLKNYLVAAAAKVHSYLNSGIGFELITERENVTEILKKVRSTGLKADVIGIIEKGKNDVVVTSKYHDNLTFNLTKAVKKHDL